MLQRVHLDGVKLPRLYIAENATDAKIAMDNGIPFVRWTLGNDELIKQLLRPVIQKMFPGIDWNRVLGKRKPFHTKVIQVVPDNTKVENKEEPINENKSIEDIGETKEEIIPFNDREFEIADIATDTRIFDCAGDNKIIEKMNITDYIGDMTSWVNIDVLQSLKLMPQFVGDILECVRANRIAHVLWSEGYNKKRHACIGNFDRSNQLRNLIILDISGSIPRGISATMLTLIDTLRTQLEAELIITASKSRYYGIEDSLPDPQTLRDFFNYGNESVEFMDIIENHIANRAWGHVFSFGDDDTPNYGGKEHLLQNVTVKKVHHYHTGKSWRSNTEYRTGYAKWCHMLSKEPEIEINTDWCWVIKE